MTSIVSSEKPVITSVYCGNRFNSRITISNEGGVPFYATATIAFEIPIIPAQTTKKPHPNPLISAKTILYSYDIISLTNNFFPIMTPEQKKLFEERVKQLSPNERVLSGSSEYLNPKRTGKKNVKPPIKLQDTPPIVKDK